MVPWLAVRGVIGGTWSVSAGQKVIAQGPIAATLKPLAEDERLVAYSDGDMHEAMLAAASIMPGRRIVPIRLDLTGPLLTPPAAYETIDLLLLGPSAVSRVRESALAVLSAGGTAVAVRSNEKPAGQWPWQQVAAPSGAGGSTLWWVLDHPPVGPRSLMDMETYAPTYGWEHGWPAEIRRRSVLLAALAAIALLGLSLWRLPLCGLGGRCAGDCGRRRGRRLDSKTIPPAVSRRRPGRMGRLDFTTGLLGLSLNAARHGCIHPVGCRPPCRSRNTGRRGCSRGHDVDQTRLLQPGPDAQAAVKLICQPDGRPDRFTAHLATDSTLGILSRSLQPMKPAFRPVDRVTPVTPDTAGSHSDDANPALTSPLYVLADQLYPGRVSGRVIEEDLVEPPAGPAAAPGRSVGSLADDLHR